MCQLCNARLVPVTVKLKYGDIMYAEHWADITPTPSSSSIWTVACHVRLETHLSPGISLISDLVHDGGMLQSELFTSRNQNLVLAKLPNSGFWRYGQFFKWNRVKMAKNGLKMVEIFWGASHMINNNIFNIFCFSTFSFGYFTNPIFWPNLEKIALKTRSRKYPKEKV